MKTKLQRIIAICLLATCVIAPISVFSETTYLNCLTCWQKTARLTITYSDWVYDETNHWRGIYPYVVCENRDCPVYGQTVMHDNTSHPRTDPIAHNHNKTVETKVSYTSLNASQHQKKTQKTKKCICGHQITTTQTDKENHKHNKNGGTTLISTTSLNDTQHQKKYKDTRKCVCGHPTSSTRTVNENHTYQMLSRKISNNGICTTTYRCTGCGRINIVESRTR